LGTTLGKNLRFLKPPVFDQCFAIAIPDQQTYHTKHDQVHYLEDEPVEAHPRDSSAPEGRFSRRRNPSQEPITADLDRLVAAIASLNFYDSFVVRMDSSIQTMCEELQGKIKESWSYSAFLARSDVAGVKTIYERSKERSRARVGARDRHS